ncbi:XdhC family protein [Nonomuraea sp. G32]|nr:XdhC family protein [Nonomuraea sp. G32]MDP4508621.1 XdhC family protein [Nonomuraea sp. G32]
MNTDGTAVGSISGGCVEGAVSTLCDLSFALFGHAHSVWSPNGPQAPVLLQRVTSGAATPRVSGCGSRH